MTKFVVNVHLDTGVICSFEVPSKDKAMEWANIIVKDGFRKVSKDGLEWYPVHRIRKVKILGEFVSPIEMQIKTV